MLTWGSVSSVFPMFWLTNKHASEVSRTSIPPESYQPVFWAEFQMRFFSKFRRSCPHSEHKSPSSTTHNQAVSSSAICGACWSRRIRSKIVKTYTRGVLNRRLTNEAGIFKERWFDASRRRSNRTHKCVLSSLSLSNLTLINRDPLLYSLYR